MMSSAIPPINSHFVPAPGEKLIGHTPHGQPIYERTINKGKSVPRIDPATGEEEWTKHPTTAERLLKKRRVVSDPQVERFIPVDGGNGTVYRQPWTPETEEEIRQRERVRLVEQKQRELAEAMVENDISTESFIKVLKGAAVGGSDDAGQEPEDEVGGEGDPFPRKAPGVGRWLLSNGEKFQGSKAEAEAAEASLKVAPGF